LVDDAQERTHDTAVAPNLLQRGTPRVSRNVTGSDGIATERVKASFLAALAKQIDRKKFYPRASRRRGEQGTVVIGFVIERDGDLTDLKVQTSSSFARLDQAVLNMLAKVSPFHPIPDSLGLDRLPISVPIAFTLLR
jgi:protein TonB